MRTNLWAKRSYTTANLVVTFGYYIGALPVKWNKTSNKMEPVTSHCDIARWACSTLFFGFWETAILVNFGKNMVASGFGHEAEFFFQDPLRLGIVAASAVGILINIHTAWKYKEFVSFINRAANFYEYFQGNYNKCN